MATEREPKISWEVKVPMLLQAGTSLTKWEEESNAIQESNFKVDKYGFFLSWHEDEKEANCLELCHVSEVRPGGIPKDGKVLDLLQSSGPEPLDERSFTLVYGTNLVDVSYLHLCASTVSLAMDWLDGLQLLLYNLSFLNCSMMIGIFKQYVKLRLLIDPQTDKITVRSICKCLSAGKYEDRVLDGLQALKLSFSKDEKIDPKDFSFEHFYQLYQRVCPRLEMEQLCIKWGGGRAPYFGVNKFVNFLNSEQRDPRLNEIIYPYYNKERALSLIWNYERSLDMLQRDRISVDGLTRYLLSNDNLLMMPCKLDVYQDMNQPLSHYFINSSHNTYLAGRQWGGKSSVEMYRQCLLAGCRCIELDCWDGPGDEPMITHGKMMCTNIAFKDVIEAIRDSAFVTSDYPVLLSFENHCSKQQQHKMAIYCTEIFGDMLLGKPLDSYPLEDGKSLPSPNTLKGRILIKNKKLKPELEAEGDSFIDISEICSDYEPTEVADQIKAADEVKENAIIDNEVDEDNGEEIVLSKFDIEESSLTEEELGKIVKFGRRLSCNLVNEAANVAAESVDINSHDVKYCSLSEYSAYLISRIMNDGLNGFSKEVVPGLPNGDSNHFCNGEGDSVCEMDDESTETFSSASSEETLSMRSRNSWDSSKLSNSNRASVASTLSQSSCQSDGSGDIVTESPSTPGLQTPTLTVTDFHYDTPTEKTGGEETADVQQPSEQRRNRDYKTNNSILESIKETSESSESGEVENKRGVNGIKDNFSEKTTKTVNGYGLEHRISSGNNNSKTDNFRSGAGANANSSSTSYSERKDSTTSEHTVSSRKESNASTQSMESNSDESEERDVLGEGFKGKRETSDKSRFGSSVRQHVLMKKTSRAVSLTPDDMAEILQVYAHHSNTTGSIHPMLSSLVNYIHPVSFTGFEEAEKKNLSHHMSSFNESTGFGLLKASPTEFIKYNRRQMSRIYPKGSRVDSGNYMPQVFWNVGCQMVSLNFQTSDLAMQLNYGKFEYNGRVGYLLKPDLLRRADRHFDPFTECMIENTIAAYVSVEVISGQFLSDKRLSTCVEVDMYGLPTDTIRKKYRTKLVQNNGMNPVYEEDEFVFRRIVFPELVLLRFAVLDDNDRLIAQRVLPLEGLQAGYRHIPLRTESNSPLPLSSLFCKFTLRTYVPETYRALVDELSEPIKFQSAADKRAAQMRVFGIDEVDVPDMGVPLSLTSKKDSVVSRGNALSKIKASSMTSISTIAGTRNSRDSISSFSNGGKHSYGSELSLVQENNVPRKQEIKFLPITLDELKKERMYIREYKKHQREMESLNKKYNKERYSMRKGHTKQLEKLVTSYEKLKENARKTYEGAAKKTSKEGEMELRKTHEIKIGYLGKTQREKANEILTAQTTEWTNLINNQVQEEIGVYETQAEGLLEVLKKVLDCGHDTQLKEITSKHEKESQEITRKQTKQSIEASRLLLKDKSIKSKEERERRQRQRDKKNLTQFTEERRRLQERQERELEELKSKHSEDKEKLVIEYRKVVSDQTELIKANGETQRKAVRTAYQTLLPSQKP